MSDLSIRATPRGSRDLYKLSNGDYLVVRPWGDGYAVTHKHNGEQCCWAVTAGAPTLATLGQVCPSGRLSDPELRVAFVWTSRKVMEDAVVLAGIAAPPDTEYADD